MVLVLVTLFLPLKYSPEREITSLLNKNTPWFLFILFYHKSASIFCGMKVDVEVLGVEGFVCYTESSLHGTKHKPAPNEW